MNNNRYIINKINKNSFDICLDLPGSKSITNRVLLIASLSSKKTIIKNFLKCDDSLYMYKALKELGINIELDEVNNTVIVNSGNLPKGNKNLYVGNAGTTMRFLTSYLNLGNGEFIIDGDHRMRERPIQDLIDALNELKCNVYSINNNGCPPVLIKANGIHGKECHISGKNSSQYISSILMSAPYSKNGIRIYVNNDLSSKPYVDMTIGIMEEFGVMTERKGYQEFYVPVSEYKSKGEFIIEPDASSASYFLAAVAILSGKIIIKNIGKNSLQGDINFIKILEKMGCRIEIYDNYILLESDGNLNGIEVDMNLMPDIVPTLAITALFAKSPTKIFNVSNLRIKESDRIKALANEIRKIGGNVNELQDGIEIYPVNSYKENLINTYNDHRIAMSFSIAGLKIPGLIIENPSCVNKSFPEFFEYFEKCFYD